ncbi:MAG: 50S ribosomal protein L18 [Clostridia bacterium]|jgi:large subunit ribosomal protein L18|nr:50S ribosomal protein L18 [Clostridia bacterium]NLF36736.1 50S ribosomal protein L18 [Clostridiaceae bacterium]MDD3092540.1 50S ribosomal protein L18 [Clostridia bacterium]MDD3971243.1 50S ribosomal protein L18 [Clostridia bacterium]MDD4542184.1 50S ribosomal protein L18 [Clostridia bacterium]
MIKNIDKNNARKKKHDRIRNHLSGTAEMPRLNVYKSLNNIYAQVIDDTKGYTLVSASTMDPSLKGTLKNGSNLEAAKQVGTLVAKKALEKGIKSVIFDRGGYVYHGKIKALADAAREAGLEF